MGRGRAEGPIDRDDAVETWLREEVVAGHREFLADPSKAVHAEEILDRIEARHGRRHKAK